MTNSKPFSIVVVDDSAFARKQIVDLLKSAKYDVVGTASSAQEALAIIREKKPELVITDVVMPEMSGIDLAKKIAELDIETSIIMVSSLTHEQVILESITQGAIDFIQKPIHSEQLFDSIEKIKQSKKVN
jgi:YesN/AraC family two-component response regulator